MVNFDFSQKAAQNLPLVLTLPKEYGLVAATATSAVILTGVYQAMNVGKHRKAAGIKYPQMYATPEQADKDEAARRFNGAQRAHQNTLEIYPTVLFTLLFSGLKHPLVAAGFGASWIVGRVFYTIGYSTGRPEKRTSGAAPLHYIGILGLLLTTIYTTGELIRDAYFR